MAALVNLLRAILALALIASLAACGGGSSPAAAVQPPPTPPAAVTGVQTPASVAVVTAKNAN